jgi:hypothetical protein
MTPTAGAPRTDLQADDRLRRARLGAQLLAGRRPRTPEAAVRHLLAIQAQDPRGFRLAVRSRTTEVVAADVDRALTDDRTLVVTTLNRGTLHLVTAEDYWWLHPVTAPLAVTGNARRLREEGVSERAADRGIDVIGAAVAEHGPLTRDALRGHLDRAHVPTTGQALPHVLMAAGLRGVIVRGPVLGREQAYVPVEWLGNRPAALDPDEARARLARRYLAGHGPATPDDLAAWSGIRLGHARAAFAAIAAETEPFDAEGRVVLRHASRRGALPPPRLLGPFDPVLHGWRARDLFVGGYRGVVTTNGIFRPCALVDGRVVATWTQPGGVVTIAPLERLSADAIERLQQDALAVLRFLGLPERAAVVTS